MASLDDIYDMLQKFDGANIEYLLITIQKGKKNGKADVFYSLKDKNSMRVLIGGLNKFTEQIDKIEDEMDKDE